MKVLELVLAVALFAPAGFAHAQSGDMKGMDMKGMDMDKKVEFEFQQRGKDHVITSVK